MIDEKKLIEILKHDISCFKTDGMKNNEMYIRVDDVLRMIEGQPKFGEWISASERLPNEGELKKAYRRNHYGFEFIVMIEGATRPTTLYYTLDGYWVDEKRETYKVIAWQPLP